MTQELTIDCKILIAKPSTILKFVSFLNVSNDIFGLNYVISHRKMTCMRYFNQHWNGSASNAKLYPQTLDSEGGAMLVQIWVHVSTPLATRNPGIYCVTCMELEVMLWCDWNQILGPRLKLLKSGLTYQRLWRWNMRFHKSQYLNLFYSPKFTLQIDYGMEIL